MFSPAEWDRIEARAQQKAKEKMGRDVSVMKFRKKSVVIDAVQLPIASAPSWLADAMDAGTTRLFTSGAAVIDTLEGTMKADVGDWIIRGVKGELYPIKADIFAETYEPVDAA